jgi:ABC-type lipoprotein export system ATPase subunit
MIQLDNVFKTYDGGLIKALNGVSCSIGSTEIVALMGPSGSGKSTLLSLLGTIDVPTSGEIRLQGKPYAQLRPFDRFRAGQIGFVFQMHYLMPHLKAAENVEVPMLALKVSRRTRRERARFLLDEVGLSRKAGAYPGELSGGERQRVAVARAFANAPRIILADEPTGSLDTETGHRVMELIINQSRQRDATVVIATHDGEIARRTDRIIHLKNGLIQS